MDQESLKKVKILVYITVIIAFVAILLRIHINKMSQQAQIQDPNQQTEQTQQTQNQEEDDDDEYYDDEDEEEDNNDNRSQQVPQENMEPAPQEEMPETMQQRPVMPQVVPQAEVYEENIETDNRHLPAIVPQKEVVEDEDRASKKTSLNFAYVESEMSKGRYNTSLELLQSLKSKAETNEDNAKINRYMATCYEKKGRLTEALNITEQNYNNTKSEEDLNKLLNLAERTGKTSIIQKYTPPKKPATQAENENNSQNKTN